MAVALSRAASLATLHSPRSSGASCARSRPEGRSAGVPAVTFRTRRRGALCFSCDVLIRGRGSAPCSPMSFLRLAKPLPFPSSAAESLNSSARTPRLPGLPAAVDDPLEGGQALEAHGPPPVKLARGGSNLRAEADFAPVVKTRASVHDDASRVDFVPPALRVGGVGRAEGLGVAGSVERDVRHRTLDAVNDAHGKNPVEVLAPPI